MRLEPNITQAALAEKLGLTQPSVSARIKHLKDAGILVSRVGVDIKKLGLVVGAVSLSTSVPYYFLSKFKGCPCFIEGSVIGGEQNLFLMFAGEDYRSLQSIVDRRLRSDRRVRDADLHVVSGLESAALCPVLFVEKGTKSPCGAICSQCAPYKEGACLGCPATWDYRGSFWAHGGRQPTSP